MTARLLSEEQLQVTFDGPMRQASEPAPEVEFWCYFDTIPPGDFRGYDCSAGDVSAVYRDVTGRFDHVLVNATVPDVFMLIILDRQEQSVYGHHLLNLREKYGLDD